jgi:beta-lactamase class A
VDLSSGSQLAHRPDERFAMCSTFKTLLVAAVSSRVDSGALGWTTPIALRAADLVEHSPVTGQRAGVEMTIDELCEAAVTTSDNTAANLLLRLCGGPEGLTAYLRGLGDPVTRLDRCEVELNENVPGDPRDTTTPRAMTTDLRLLFSGNAVSPGSRERLWRWHRATSTGPDRLRSGLPSSWTLAHKTGTGSNGATNDVGVVTSRDRAPLIIGCFYTGSGAPLEAREAVLADVARAIVRSIA